jgi:hypothetical protein
MILFNQSHIPPKIINLSQIKIIHLILSLIHYLIYYNLA